MAHPPLVSVYLPTHNRAALLHGAIASVLAQQYRNLELIVVDDASTDGTAAVLAAAAAADPRVRALQRDHAGGPAAARNLAIRAARGDFITGLDDDDRMLPGRVGTLLAAYRDDYSLVCSPAWIQGPRWARPQFSGGKVITLDDLLCRNEVGNQVLTRTARLLEIGLFDERLAAWEDYDLWTRLVQRFGPALRLAEPTFICREDPQAARISTSWRAPQGALEYFERYRHSMTPLQHRSQRLMQCAISGRPMRLDEARACWGPGTRRQVVRTWVSSNAPWSRTLRDAWWRWRWPASRLPGMPTEPVPGH
jgi:glycosyltransferase involved in cell wall biosynthesis